MIFIPDSQLDAWLQEDIHGGDLTTRALGIGDLPGQISFWRRQSGYASGVQLAARLLRRLNLNARPCVNDGDPIPANTLLLQANGSAAALHQGWKVAQNLLEWCGGVADCLADMIHRLRRYQPAGQIACTRKTPPGCKLLALQAVLDGGGLIHRAGCGETVLLFANHRRFWPDNHDWHGMISRLRLQAPEKQIIVEIDHPQQARHALQAAPDMLQLDKFSPHEARQTQQLARQLAPACRLLLAGGITPDTIEQYAQTGIPLLVTSAPYHAPPADIKVRLTPL